MMESTVVIPGNFLDRYMPSTQRLLDQINAAPSLEFLSIPPGNKLEKLAGDKKGFRSLRINEQWRIIFRWAAKDFYDVKIVDYHRR